MVSGIGIRYGPPYTLLRISYGQAGTEAGVAPRRRSQPQEAFVPLGREQRRGAPRRRRGRRRGRRQRLVWERGERGSVSVPTLP
eukprot:1619853-Rhodomonas_salina.4